MLPKFADNRAPNSLASRLRANRNQWFKRMIESLARPLKILDIGGTPAVWERLKFVNQPDIEITLLNILQFKTSYSNVRSVVGDARDMHQFRDQEFDAVYSNSVIEHVGAIEDMRRMANEIQRVGRRYFLQTPYRYFPVEPHFVFPLFQFLPFSLQVCLVQHFSLGWFPKLERVPAEQTVRSIYLLSKDEMHALFPSAHHAEEKLFGLTKSLVAYKM